MRDDQDIDKTAGELRERFRTAGQEHVFTFWDHLEAGQRRQLLEQLTAIDLELISKLASTAGAEPAPKTGDISPAPALRLQDEPSFTSRQEALHHGEELLAAGKVALLLVAGGKGRRLGWDGPKGCFPVAPLSERSLFEIHAAKIRRLGKIHGVSIPWYIMTSNATDAETRSCFEENDFFKISPADIRFMKQASLPILDQQGRLILENPGRIAASPNGHGGCYAALRDSGALEDARSRGIEHIFYFQVDNPLVALADPLFIGLHDLAESQMSLKVLEKTGPEEKIGVIALRDDNAEVIEYTDLSAEKASLRNPRGELQFALGSIGIHLLRRDFIENILSVESAMPLHPVKKQVAAIDRNARPVKIDAIQFETFVFDALRLAQRFFNLEVKREHEFAPLKNLTGIDSLETCRELLMQEHRRWLAQAGVTASGPVEIDPLAGISSEDIQPGLEPRRGEVFTRPLLVSRNEAGEITVCEQQ